MKEYKKIIEFLALAIFIAFMGKGVMFGLLTGMVVAVCKKIYNMISSYEQQIESPFESVGIGALAGLAVSLIKMII